MLLSPRRHVLSVVTTTAVLSFTVLACGSSTTTGTGSGSSTGTASTPSSGGTLTGTWDLLASANGETKTGQVVLSSTQLTVSIGSYVLSYKVDGSVLTATWTDGGHTNSIPLTRIADSNPPSYGAIPLALDGTWAFGPEGDQLVLTAFSGYAGAIANDYVSFPDPLPEPTPNQTYQAERMEADDSIFGDLGGIWTAAASDSESGCAVGFQGNIFVSDCEDTGSALDGTCTLTFDSSLSAASGTSGDTELSAKRR